MKEKRWTKAGRDMRKSNPSLFTSGGGSSQPLKGGAHRRDIDYKRSDKRNEERKASRGEFDE